MSIAYDSYINKHCRNVEASYQWIVTNAPEILKKVPETVNIYTDIIVLHDNSKWTKEEYDAYDDYFYGSVKSTAVRDEFNKAWLHHIHTNRHHWQYWVLINDDPNNGEIALRMPYEYIVEMVCDWMSFAIESNELQNLFDFYESRKNHIKLHPKTRKDLEYILDTIKTKKGGVL